ncbi:hypothetical protein FB451DRAFT_1171657 [Mycena latifolia]|nr:hypothetical protein FB451DRAFT_1171657 [Mycena latifolia]
MASFCCSLHLGPLSPAVHTFTHATEVTADSHLHGTTQNVRSPCPAESQCDSSYMIFRGPGALDPGARTGSVPTAIIAVQKHGKARKLQQLLARLSRGWLDFRWLDARRVVSKYRPQLRTWAMSHVPGRGSGGDVEVQSRDCITVSRRSIYHLPPSSSSIFKFLSTISGSLFSGSATSDPAMV